MESLQYDPLTKQQIKDTLYDFLYTPVQKQFKLRLDTLIIRNTLLSGYSHKSFVYKGKTYSCDTEAPPRKWNKLLPELKGQMDQYLAELETINSQEIPYVLGFINKVLNSSHAIDDYLKLFPDCIHAPLKKLAATCPCKTQMLTQAKSASLLEQSETPINLIKQRMVTNLLI
jgi:hypothetical protein